MTVSLTPVVAGAVVVAAVVVGAVVVVPSPTVLVKVGIVVPVVGGGNVKVSGRVPVVIAPVWVGGPRVLSVGFVGAAPRRSRGSSSSPVAARTIAAAARAMSSSARNVAQNH